MIKSGNFKGKLTSKEYRIFYLLSANINWDIIQVPGIICCNLPGSSLILTFNKKRKQFKSNTFPLQISSTINLLTEIGFKKKIPRLKKNLDFEYIID
jgi:hypothetical protein